MVMAGIMMRMSKTGTRGVKSGVVACRPLMYLFSWFGFCAFILYAAVAPDHVFHLRLCVFA